jgi:hypothetical protein
MFDSLSVRVGLLSLAVLGLILIRRKLYPKPYPGIPYNEASARRITGDVPDLAPVIKESGEFSNALFEVTTRKLGVPIAQLLFPGVRKPLIILDDPREIEDLVVRRDKEFDKAPMAIDIFGPMFSRASNAQYTTPELKAQKRLWADVMTADFLRRVAAPNIHKSTLDLIELWRLRAQSPTKDGLVNVHEDFKDATLDAIWLAFFGEAAGTTRFEIQKLQRQLEGSGTTPSAEEHAPVGAFLREQVAYITDTIAKNSRTPSPKLFQKLETYTPRYRRFRASVEGEMARCMKKAVERYQSKTVGDLETDAADTCAMDLVLRRQILQAKKAGVPPSDPTKDLNMLDELFVMLVGVRSSPTLSLD